jgi:dihydropyrimidinase
MTVDFVFTGGKVATADSVGEYGIAVDDGKIVAIAKEPNLPKANKTVNLKGKVVMPGAIDAHTHWGVFALGNWDVFEHEARTESASAACGGVTTAMHSIWDSESYTPHIRRKDAIIKANSSVDVVYYAVLMHVKHYIEMDDYFRQGVSSYKHFMANDFAMSPDDTLMYMSFSKIASKGGTAMVHHEICGPIYAKVWEVLRKEKRPDLAEWNDLSGLHTNKELQKVLSKRMPKKNLKAWTDLRPDELEEEAMRKTEFLAGFTGARVYSVHTTIKEGLDVAKNAKQRRLKYHIETCPQYLTFTKYDKKIGVGGKINPPLREKSDNEALWEGIREGTVESMGTDHCSPVKKAWKTNDIWTTAAGFPGSETMLPVLLSEGFNRRSIPLESIVRATSYNTARIHRIPNKGKIELGYDADLVVVDLKEKFRPSADNLHSGADFTLYEGWNFTGWPTMTMVRGNVVMEEHQLVTKPGFARRVKTIGSRAHAA